MRHECVAFTYPTVSSERGIHIPVAARTGLAIMMASRWKRPSATNTMASAVALAAVSFSTGAVQPSTSPGDNGLLCGTASAGYSVASSARTAWMALPNWMVPASASRLRTERAPTPGHASASRARGGIAPSRPPVEAMPVPLGMRRLTWPGEGSCGGWWRRGARGRTGCPRTRTSWAPASHSRLKRENTTARLGQSRGVGGVGVTSVRSTGTRHEWP
jgi:hypothetical protein